MRIKPEELFPRNGDLCIKLHYYESADSIDVEGLYQAFKARLMREIAVTSPELLEPAHLFDNTDEDQP